MGEWVPMIRKQMFLRPNGLCYHHQATVCKVQLLLVFVMVFSVSFCIITDCQEFSVANGTVKNSNITYGMRATITCKEGFTLVGQPNITCTLGVWHGDIATCHSGITDMWHITA